jgi:hypothetical protein
MVLILSVTGTEKLIGLEDLMMNSSGLLKTAECKGKTTI